jgi:hypothetical protein
MAVPTIITDHDARAKARLLQQYKGKPNLEDFLDALNAQTQDYEDAVHPMLELLDIDTMVDDQLDKIGEIVTEPRNGASDANYRIAIRGKIAVMVGSGTPDEIIALFERITSSTNMFFWEDEDVPATFGIWGDAASYPASTLDQLDNAAPAAVQVSTLVRWQKEGSSDLITWEDTSTAYLNYRSNGGG